MQKKFVSRAQLWQCSESSLTLQLSNGWACGRASFVAYIVRD